MNKLKWSYVCICEGKYQKEELSIFHKKGMNPDVKNGILSIKFAHTEIKYFMELADMQNKQTDKLTTMYPNGLNFVGS